MSAVLADTHAVLWYLFEPARLSSAADAALTGAETAGDAIYISVISLVEVIYLVEKLRLPATVWTDLLAAVDAPATPFRIIDADMLVARELHNIPRNLVPDMPDRIIACTALVHKLPLVTADARIRKAPIPTIW